MNRRRSYVSLVLTAVALVAVGSMILPMVDSGAELTQMRNAFIAVPGESQHFDWRPDEVPEGFLVERAEPPEEFRLAVSNVLGEEPKDASNFERTLALARHLASGPGPGEGVKASTRESYRAILTEERGYCSDYTQVMNGLAHTAEIPVREWGMSFDDYSGRGHAFSEVYDDELGQWVFVDTFFSLYAVDPRDGAPLSVLQLRDRLASGDDRTVEIRKIDPERFGFKTPERAAAYYREGAERFFLYYGNNVFSYDANEAVAALSGLSRAAEETLGILFNIRPDIRLFPTGKNEPGMQALFARRRRFLMLIAVAGILTAVVFFQLIAIARRPGPPTPHRA